MNNQYQEPNRVVVHKVEDGRVTDVTEDTTDKLPKVKAYRTLDREKIQELIKNPIRTKFVNPDGSPIEQD